MYSKNLTETVNQHNMHMMQCNACPLRYVQPDPMGTRAHCGGSDSGGAPTAQAHNTAERAVRSNTAERAVRSNACTAAERAARSGAYANASQIQS